MAFDPLLLNGVTDPTTKHYGFWSGFGSVVVPPLLNLLWILPLYFWHHNCHQKGCLRIGKHPHKHLKFCKHHHPAMGGK